MSVHQLLCTPRVLLDLCLCSTWTNMNFSLIVHLSRFDYTSAMPSINCNLKNTRIEKIFVYNKHIVYIWLSVLPIWNVSCHWFHLANNTNCLKRLWLYICTHGPPDMCVTEEQTMSLWLVVMEGVPYCRSETLWESSTEVAAWQLVTSALFPQWSSQLLA